MEFICIFMSIALIFVLLGLYNKINYLIKNFKKYEVVDARVIDFKKKKGFSGNVHISPIVEYYFEGVHYVMNHKTIASSEDVYKIDEIVKLRVYPRKPHKAIYVMDASVLFYVVAAFFIFLSFITYLVVIYVLN